MILCRSAAEADAALAAVTAWVTEAGLTLHPEKARVMDASNAAGSTSWAITSSGA